MKKIIFVQTPYQLIVSLYIKNQFCNEDDKVDLVITDTFNNYEVVSQKVKDKNIFSNVYVVKVKDVLLPQKNKIRNLKKLYYVLRPKMMIKKILGNINFYDEMYYCNYDAFVATFRSYFALAKRPMKIYCFEEGFISYLPIEEVIPKRGFIKIIEKRNKIFKISNIVRENIDGLIVFEPNLVLQKPSYPIYKLDRENNKNYIHNLIDYIFNASQVIKNYDKRYIIFEDSLLANDPSVDDEKVFDKIIDIVGKDNAIIKLHPRSMEDRFTKKGIKTMGSDGIPWEALACVGDFSGKVLISICSGCITTYKMLFGNRMKAYMLFKFLKPKLEVFSPKYYSFWDNFEDDGGVHMPESEEEFYNELRNDVIKNEKNN